MSTFEKPRLRPVSKQMAAHCTGRTDDRWSLIINHPPGVWDALLQLYFEQVKTKPPKSEIDENVFEAPEAKGQFSHISLRKTQGKESDAEPPNAFETPEAKGHFSQVSLRKAPEKKPSFVRENDTPSFKPSKSGGLVPDAEGRIVAASKPVAPSLVQHLDLTNVLHIDLSNNSLSEQVQLGLIASVLKSSSVQTLNLAGNANIDKVLKAKDIADNRTLVSVKASFVNPQGELERALERNENLFRYMNAIRKVSSPLIRITPRDNDMVARIIRVINNDPSVQELVIDSDIRFRHLSAGMVLDLAQSLRLNFHLKTMKINNVELGNTFLSMLATSMESNIALTMLDLSNNEITNEAMVDFARAMTKNSTLNHVNLSKMRAPILSQAEATVFQALEQNSTLLEFQLDLRSKESQAKLEGIIRKNTKKPLKSSEFDEKLLTFLKKEAKEAETILSERASDEEALQLKPDDWDYLHELSQLADTYNALDNAYEEEEEGQRTGQEISKNAEIAKLSLTQLKKTVDSMPADGSFLTEEFITKYIVDNNESGAVIFEFTNQFKMFKRFQIGDKARAFIVKKFVEVLLAHPRCKDFTHLHMANINCSDDLLERLSEKCLANPQLLPKLHLINLETNNISGPGVVALAGCLRDGSTMRYLQTIKLENQTSLMKTEAEDAIAKSLMVNKSVLRLGLRVRNLLERERVGRCLQRNMDYLRKARREHAAKMGKVVKRQRNKMEKYIDSIAANDPSITKVEIIGDPTFLGLNSVEVLKAGASFTGNSHVTRVKLCNLNLNDKFAAELGKALPSSKIEYLCLDSNNMSGEGVKEIVKGIASSKTLTEFQVRHQRKTIAASDEDMISTLLGSNTSLVKLGIDMRSHGARSKLDKRLSENVAQQRRARKNKGPVASSTDKIRCNQVRDLFRKVADNDSATRKVELDQDKEFLLMDRRDKLRFFETLRSNKTVETLSLHGLQLDNAIAEELAYILNTNNTIRHLSLDKNDFTSQGVLAVALAALASKNVTSLSIRNPRFKLTNEDAEKLVSTLEKKPALKTCHIQFRKEEHKERLSRALG